jgi:endonuclease YncB( thermonuclease family)
MGIGTNFGMRTNTIRLGHNVRTRRMSPRRIRQTAGARVIHVVDGSVFEVRKNNGEIVTVRTLGSEAPLLLAGSDKQQCFALEAKADLEHLILYKNVELEKDRNYHTDQYGRLLRYVRLNSLDVGGWMIGNGNAFSDSRNSHRREDDYHARQAEAMDYERGLWGHVCEYNSNLDTIDVLP